MLSEKNIFIFKKFIFVFETLSLLIASYWSQISTQENLQIKPSQVEILALNGGWHV